MMSMYELRLLAGTSSHHELYISERGLSFEEDFTLEQQEAMKFVKSLALEFAKPAPDERAIRRAEEKFWSKIQHIQANKTAT